MQAISNLQVLGLLPFLLLRKKIRKMEIVTGPQKNLSNYGNHGSLQPGLSPAMIPVGRKAIAADLRLFVSCLLTTFVNDLNVCLNNQFEDRLNFLYNSSPHPWELSLISFLLASVFVTPVLAYRERPLTERNVRVSKRCVANFHQGR